MALSDIFKGKPEEIKQVPTASPEVIQFQKEILPILKQQLGQPRFTPQQESAIGQLLNLGVQQAKQPQFTKGQTKALDVGLSAISPLQQYIKAFKPFDFDPIRKQAESAFYQQTVPTIAQRFASFGSGIGSSAFRGALGKAGAGLRENLAALQAQIGLQREPLQLQLLQNLLGLGLQPRTSQALTPALLSAGLTSPFEKGQVGPLLSAAFQPTSQATYTPGSPSPFSQFLGGALPLAGGALGAFLGGPAGFGVGAGAGGSLASLFS